MYFNDANAERCECVIVGFRDECVCVCRGSTVCLHSVGSDLAEQIAEPTWHVSAFGLEKHHVVAVDEAKLQACGAENVDCSLVIKLSQGPKRSRGFPGKVKGRLPE